MNAGVRLLTAGLCCGFLLAHAAAAVGDGDRQLWISGHSTYIYGEPGLGGGLGIPFPWEVVIQFRIEAGEYRAGSGSTRWLDKLAPVSNPPGWFRCREISGTYLDSNLRLHETPRARFAAFPVTGELRDGWLVLQPRYEPPGDYLTLTYECTSEAGVVDNWFALAERGRQVLGKRQDAEKDVAHRRVRVRDVISLPPKIAIELPPQVGWRLSQGIAAADARVVDRLRRLN